MTLPNSIISDLAETLNLSVITGVPDSVLAPAVDFLGGQDLSHVRAVNEGSAVGIAIGSFLATSRAGLVYFQNSGLSNALNPLLSLAHQNVYGIPMVLLVGWRGMPGTIDEPQHMVQGEVTREMVSFFSDNLMVLKNELSNLDVQIINEKLAARQIVVLLVPPKSFVANVPPAELFKSENPSRLDVLRVLVGILRKEDLVVATTGYTSREYAYVAQELGLDDLPHFLSVGGMGHSGSIAFGAALNWQGRVFCIDGDGAMLMHLGSLVSSGMGPANFTHILLRNNLHESVGTQPTAGESFDFAGLASTAGYEVLGFDELSGLGGVLNQEASGQSRFIEIPIKPGTIENLPRPKRTPEELLAFLIAARNT
jgi:phosphonopyruvate decarboxylase